MKTDSTPQLSPITQTWVIGFLRIFYSSYNEKITLYKKGTTMFTQTLIAIIGIAFFAASTVLYYARMFS